MIGIRLKPVMGYDGAFLGKAFRIFFFGFWFKLFVLNLFLQECNLFLKQRFRAYNTGQLL